MHRIANYCGLISLAYLLSACVPAHHNKASAPLVGTSWELMSIQSMDNATGTTHISEPAYYALTFGRDGRASFRLNCNRATGDWSAQPGRGDSGQLAFGPLAATKALCPPPSEDERVARDMAYVRSYLLREGQLHMSLYADGGIYTWRRSGR